MQFHGTQLIIFFAVLVQGSHSTADECQDAVAPPTKPRGVNQVGRSSAMPLFKLHVKPVRNGRKSKKVMEYKISVSAEKGEQFRFNKATLAVTSNGTCGSGELRFQPQDFVEVEQEETNHCPRLITTRRTTHMTELTPLIWVPPSCGCVQFRMLVVTSDGSPPVYYAENDGVSSGPLAKTVCLAAQSHTGKISRDERLESLCHVIDKHSSSEILSRSDFLRQRDLQTRWMDQYGLERALEVRRSDAKICCNQKRHEDRMTCFDNVRRRRIDQFCAEGRADIPFREFRKQHMMKLEKSCCFILGEFRYLCFGSNDELTSRAREQVGGTSAFDFSMDSTDVANDLAEFGSRLHLDQFLRPKTFFNEQTHEFDVEGAYEEEEDVEDFDDGNVTDGGKTLDDYKMEEGEEAEEEEDDEEEMKEVVGVSTAASKRTSQTRSDKYKRERVSKTHGVESGRLNGKETSKNNIRKLSHRNNSKANKRLVSSAERKRKSRNGRHHKRRRGSAEQRGRMRKTQHRGGKISSQEKAFHRKRSKEVRGQGNKKQSQPMEGHGIGGVRLEDDFEGHGAASRDKTLKKLQRKMKRLRLLSECCLEGTESGRQVYGGLEQVTEECLHSSSKYAGHSRLLGRKHRRKCRRQFVECCTEAAKKGLTMASHEFRDEFHLEDTNPIDSRYISQTLSRRGRPADAFDASLPDRPQREHGFPRSSGPYHHDQRNHGSYNNVDQDQQRRYVSGVAPKEMHSKPKKEEFGPSSKDERQSTDYLNLGIFQSPDDFDRDFSRQHPDRYPVDRLGFDQHSEDFEQEQLLTVESGRNKNKQERFHDATTTNQKLPIVQKVGGSPNQRETPPETDKSLPRNPVRMQPKETKVKTTEYIGMVNVSTMVNIVRENKKESSKPKQLDGRNGGTDLFDKVKGQEKGVGEKEGERRGLQSEKVEEVENVDIDGSLFERKTIRNVGEVMGHGDVRDRQEEKGKIEETPEKEEMRRKQGVSSRKSKDLNKDGIEKDEEQTYDAFGEDGDNPEGEKEEVDDDDDDDDDDDGDDPFGLESIDQLEAEKEKLSSFLRQVRLQTANELVDENENNKVRNNPNNKIEEGQHNDHRHMDKFVSITHHHKHSREIPTPKPDLGTSSRSNVPTLNSESSSLRQGRSRSEEEEAGRKPKNAESVKRKHKRKKEMTNRGKNKRPQGMHSNTNSRFSKIGALDSRELAEKHARASMTALDSREMADQYHRKPNRQRISDYRSYRQPSSTRRRKSRKHYWF